MTQRDEKGLLREVFFCPGINPNPPPSHKEISIETSTCVRFSVFQRQCIGCAPTLEPLLNSIAERLEIADQVALSKWDSKNRWKIRSANKK